MFQAQNRATKLAPDCPLFPTYIPEDVHGLPSLSSCVARLCHGAAEAVVASELG
jgi:hypothetical protein